MENTYVGPFLVVKKLGTNRRQRVYHARQTEQNRDIALKFIAVPSGADWASVVEKIELEATELKKLRHPHLVTLFGAGVHQDQIFFASELVEGESLASLLARRGKIAPDLVVEYGRQIADVLHYLHSRDLIHSKLTPEKILIGADHQIKLADLRINRSKRRRWDTSRLRELDIAAYLAPEQFSEGATAKSDLYSLGVLIYEMLTGKLPYDLDNIGRMAKLKSIAAPPSVAAEVMGCPIWLDKLVTQMLQPDPRKRPHSAKAVALAFDEIKKLDASQKSTAAQVVGSFNALNAGVDKTEARELLGKKKKKREPESSVFETFQTVPFLMISLALIVACLAFMLWPENLSQRLDRYTEMVNSNNPEKWSQARSKLKEMKERTSDDVISDQVTGLYDQVRRKILVQRAETGQPSRLHSENVQAFHQAFNLEKDEKPIEALSIYQQLVRNIPSNHDEHYIAAEADQRIDKLQSKVLIPDTVEEVAEFLKTLSTGETAGEINFHNETLGKVIIKFAGEREFAEIVEEAKQILENNRRQLFELGSYAETLNQG